MTVAAILLVYAASAGTIGSRLLGRARWALRAPLLGIVICLAAAWSVVAALGLAGLTLAVHATALGDGLSHLIGACVLRLRDAYATPGGATVAGLGLILAGAVLARTALTAATHLRAVRRQAVQHAQTARLVGRPDPDLGATLVVLAAAGGPTPGLAAAATDAVQRIQRLLRPAEPLSRARRRLLGAAAAALALTPVLLALAPAMVALVLGRVPTA